MLKDNEVTHRFVMDNYENKHTARAAYLSAGGTLKATKALCKNEVDSFFAIVRPPGHHAFCSNIGGFCFFNNIAIATKFA